MIRLTLPIKTVSEANQREHWAVKAKRAARQQSAVALSLRSLLVGKSRLPAAVKLTRIGPRKLDGDNLQSAFKACRDSVAKCLGVDDGSDQVTWTYAQRCGGPGVYAVEVEIGER